MSDNSTKKKHDVLGVSISSASYKLRKMVLFDILRRHNENICYRCGKTIDNVDELSMDHKIDWLNAPNAKELFWDMDNIAFSHLKCNTVAGQEEAAERLRVAAKEYLDATVEGTATVGHQKRLNAAIEAMT